MSHLSSGRDRAIVVALFIFGAVAIVLGALRCSRPNEIDKIEIQAEPNPGPPGSVPMHGLPSAVSPTHPSLSGRSGDFQR